MTEAQVENNVETEGQKAAEKAAEKAAKAEAKAKATAEKAAAKEAAKAAKDAEKAAAKEAAKAAKEAAKAAKDAEKAAAKEQKVSKMPEQNEIRRPKPETLCGKAWAIFDSVSQKNGAPASISECMAIGSAQGLNDATMRTQYARWRKFHGITGRIEAVKPEAPTQEAA